MSYQPPLPQIVHQQVTRPPSNGQAVTSLVLGIIAIVTGVWSPIPLIGMFPAFIAFPLAVLAIVFGHTGLSASNKIGVGRGQAITGMILGYITLGIILLTFLIWVISLATGSILSPLLSYQL